MNDITYLLAGIQLEDSEQTEQMGKHVFNSMFRENPVTLQQIARHNLRELSMNTKKEN